MESKKRMNKEDYNLTGILNALLGERPSLPDMGKTFLESSCTSEHMKDGQYTSQEISAAKNFLSWSLDKKKYEERINVDGEIFKEYCAEMNPSPQVKSSLRRVFREHIVPSFAQIQDQYEQSRTEASPGLDGRYKWINKMKANMEAHGEEFLDPREPGEYGRSSGSRGGR